MLSPGILRYFVCGLTMFLFHRPLITKHRIFCNPGCRSNTKGTTHYQWGTYQLVKNPTACRMRNNSSFYQVDSSGFVMGAFHPHSHYQQSTSLHRYCTNISSELCTPLLATVVLVVCRPTRVDISHISYVAVLCTVLGSILLQVLPWNVLDIGPTTQHPSVLQ